MEQTGQAEHFKQFGPGRRWRRIGVVVLVCVVLAAAVCLLARGGSGASLEERIAVIDARRALPPRENAATVYDRLLRTEVIAGDPTDPGLTPAGLAGLVAAANMESCHFPLSAGWQCYRDHTPYLTAMRAWSRALDNAATKDIAEGRVDAAGEKLCCLIRMGEHARQQSLLIDFLLGCEMETRAWVLLREWVMAADGTEEHLRLAETLPARLANDWEQLSGPMREVQPLVAASIRAKWGLRQRLENWWRQRGARDPMAVAREKYLRLLSLRRGVRVLTGLRRYHDANERWPESLDEIKALVPAPALVDPYTEQPFVYVRMDDVFRLFARGPNGRNDSHAPARQADDVRIWPP